LIGGMPAVFAAVALAVGGGSFALALAIRARRGGLRRRRSSTGGEGRGRRNSILVLPAQDVPQSRRSSVVFVPPPSSGKVGILVHGCHLQADGWEDIVWGAPPLRMGRLPQAVLLAWEESAQVVLLGTGASFSSTGMVEGEFTLQYLLSHLDELHDFEALRHIPLEEVQRLVKKIAVAETKSQNTAEEVLAGFHEFAARKCTRAILVSSPTHLPRCLACACDVHHRHPGVFAGAVYACPSETCYASFEANDVVVVEPPHRGDRDKALDELPFHEMVRRSFRISGPQRVAFLQQFDALLQTYNA